MMNGMKRHETTTGALQPESDIHRIKWVIIFGFWTFFSLLYANQIFFGMHHAPNMHHSWWRIAGWQLAIWYLWGFLTPLILRLAQEFPLHRPRWVRALLVHLSVSTVLCFGHVAAVTWLRMSIRPFDVWSDVRPFSRQYTTDLNDCFLIDFLVYWAILGVGYAFDFYGRFREREAVAARLEAELAQSRIETLKLQLQPHFLFNTLHTIAGLIRSDQKELAIEMIVGLGDLLRYVIESSSQQEISLREEAKFIALYVEIQKVRFGDGLTVTMDIDDETLDALVPNLILQPLVENAIQHGTALSDSSGVIAIGAHRNNGRLQLKVLDNGPGLALGWQMKNNVGVGLANTGKRLKHLYGDDQKFLLRNNQAGGAMALVEIPFRVGSVETSGR
jgi:signal transduction histidine kinase